MARKQTTKTEGQVQCFSEKNQSRINQSFRDIKVKCYQKFKSQHYLKPTTPINFKSSRSEISKSVGKVQQHQCHFYQNIKQSQSQKEEIKLLKNKINELQEQNKKMFQKMKEMQQKNAQIKKESGYFKYQNDVLQTMLKNLLLQRQKMRIKQNKKNNSNKKPFEPNLKQKQILNKLLSRIKKYNQ